MNSLKFIFILIPALFLAGCQTLDIADNRPTNVAHIEKTDAQWQQHLQQLKQINSYTSAGQLGYISSKERFSARFNWQYRNTQSYTLLLSSTITSSTLTFDMHPYGLTISDNKGNQRSAADAKLLLQEIIGMDIPLEHFSTWLKGQPNEQADYNVGSNHLLASFSYPVDGANWTADYLNYQPVGNHMMPRDILLKNSDQTLKIRIDHWAF
ncbi:MAG: lipoprotein insertase outer membrane protein LolB [[Pasteurella] mairii]|uniref:Outer-membrane lipoprotein LolB n=1 Tax=[Pasteurella] mairii TaxID=757 RepID=A0A379B352_9PAST|nr:lipoprotein insertase outer membrane protein LolB [[Pasteurella] mairii]SUB33017.1 outer-membrane lipoprotein LolB [[Pasteurella] mairii]